VIAKVGEQKVARLRKRALLTRLPMVWLLASAGARIQEAAGSTFAGSGALFYEQVQMSGVVPQVAAMLGPCAAGTAYIPGLADYVPMVKDTSSMALGGARLVKAATGEETSDHAMGGSQIHCYISGVGDLEVDDDAACIAAVREFLSYLPSISPSPVTTPSAGVRSGSVGPPVIECWCASMPSSTNVSASKSRLTRSRAVSFFLSCCCVMRSSPPMASALARRAWRSSVSCSNPADALSSGTSGVSAP